MAYSQIFSTDSVLLHMEGADSSEVLGHLTDALCARNSELAGRRDEVLQALVERESRGSTGADGVGLPHVKLAGVSQVTAIIGIHQSGVDFDALDGQLVQVFFSVIRPEEGAEEHLGLLRWLASIAQHEDFVSFACQAKEAQEVLDLLSELAST
jgi:mannitol/fructose-specific phosphotransferase system IIA component (Ntr-type)